MHSNPIKGESEYISSNFTAHQLLWVLMLRITNVSKDVHWRLRTVISK